MSHENSQFEIPGIQLRESKTQPRVSLSREIGEAQITHTIFGKAKVRIIRKNDKLHRALWLGAGIVVTAIAAAVWQGWFASQQTEPQQDTSINFSVNPEAQANVPVPHAGNTGSSGILPTIKSEPTTPSATAINSPAAIQKIAPQPAGLKDSGQIGDKPAAQSKPGMIKPKPVDVKPLTAGNPQTVPTIESQDVLKKQADKPQPAGMTPLKRPVAPAVATVPVVKPAASTPAAATPMSVPSGKEESATQSPVDDTQLSAPINVPGK